MAVRAIVVMQLKGDLLAAKALMQEVASFTREHFGERFVFDPFVDPMTGRVVWLNVVSDEESLVQWEQDMGEKTGFRSRVREVLPPRLGRHRPLGLPNPRASSAETGRLGP